MSVRGATPSQGTFHVISGDGYSPPLSNILALVAPLIL